MDIVMETKYIRLIVSAWLLWFAVLGMPAVAAVAAGDSIPNSGIAAQQQPVNQSVSHATRFFIDEGYFLEGDTEIIRAYISASQGRLQISGESSAAFLSVKGYYVPEKWEVYWTIRQACHMAFPHMQPGKLVNCIPGVQAMSLKRNFVQTWQQAYGESAFDYIPSSYLIPEQYWLWRSHILATSSPEHSKWVLKANIHRGKGVSVVPQHQALSQALMHSKSYLDSTSSSSSSGSSSGGDDVVYHTILVQKYLEPQMVIAGRSSYIRVWLLVTSITPLRAYLYKGGFAIFGKQKGSSISSNATAAAGNASSSSDDLIVNLWIQNRDKSPIWSLYQLEQYLDAHAEIVQPLPQQQQQQSGTGAATAHDQQQQRRTFADAWKDMQATASLVLAAALPSMRSAAAEANAPVTGTFEYFGLDFVFDAHLRPWLLEVNAVPSMARRKKSDCSGSKATANCQLYTAAPGSSSSSNSSSNVTDDFDQQKEQFVHDMLALLGLPVDAARPAAAAAADGLQLLRMSAVAAAAADAHAHHNSSSSAGKRKLSWSRTLRLSRKLQRREQQQWRNLQQVVEEQTQSAEPHRRHHHRDPNMLQKPHKNKAAPAASAAANADKAAQQPHQLGTAVGVPQLLGWTGPVRKVTDLPTEVQAVLCPGSSNTPDDAEQAAFECITCLTATDLAAIAAAEGELNRAGNFVPAYDLIPAHSLSSRAAGPMPPEPAGAATANSSRGISNATRPLVPGVAYLSQDRSVWQKLYDTWLAVSTKGVGLKDLGLMKYYTTSSKVVAGQRLKLNRQDYVMSAWLRVRQQAGRQCSQDSLSGKNAVISAACVKHMLKQLVSHCYIS